MSGENLTGLVISCVLGLMIIGIAILLLMGKGSFLIAGYNTMSKDEKEKYDTKALCRFIGKILLPIGIFTPCIAIAAINKINWISIAYAGLVVILVVFAVVYCNTGNRFKN